MTDTTFSPKHTLEVAGSCLCLHAQRAARALARHFDDAFRPLELTNGQFSLLMSLNRPEPPTVRETASFLAMDRTTLTALLKPLERRELVIVTPDEKDRRKRRLRLTPAGHALLHEAYPIWQRAHAELETLISDAEALRIGLKALVAHIDEAVSAW
ncbi:MULTISPECIES: MarR family winged helix-turn-helix transcriptional regulator [Halomonadaceae]|uniref:MarR family winged helix-turn-helix transcriptional regulator n=1 Tax=Halomonadaceae TaxID=28256 RepID=UPI00159B2999|nr:MULTISPECIES: MarR family winged helix-turn-helix transcriptional regulator [Halomonas]QJQ96320.1 winged helix-turn-helix transcriptional regulator [Halomonas sp. PA5]